MIIPVLGVQISKSPASEDREEGEASGSVDPSPSQELAG